MDHLFPTKRHILASLREAETLVEDLCSICAATPTDHTLLLARRDPEMHDEALRHACNRRGARMGMLLEDLDALLASSERDDASLAPRHVKTWATFLPSQTRVSQEMLDDLASTQTSLRSHIERLAPLECDDTSSSYSDYSDSETSGSESSSRKRRSGKSGGSGGSGGSSGSGDDEEEEASGDEEEESDE